MRRRTLQTVVALLLAGLWGGGLGLAHYGGDIGALGRIEAAMTDLRALARGERPAPDVVTIVAIDDDSVRRAGRYPLPRQALAKLIERIGRLQPKAIAVDLLLLDESAGDGDVALVQALRLQPTALAAAAVFSDAVQTVLAEPTAPFERLPQAARLLLPLPAFAAVAAVGIVNVVTDRSGTPRAIPLLFRSSDQIALSLPLQVAALASGSTPAIAPDRVTVGGRSVATDLDHSLPLSFYGRRGSIRTVSAAAVHDGALAREAVQDRIVVIGATVTGGGDFFPTPFDPVMPGVEIVATAIAHLMTGDGLRRDRPVRIADSVSALLLPLLLVGLLAWRRNAIGLIMTAAVLALWLGANFVAFSRGIGVSAALPLAAAVPPAMLFGALQLWSGRSRAQHFADRSAVLQQFQSPAIGDWLARDPGFLVEPVQQTATAVFIDLSGFTGLSETLGPDAVRTLLKDFHGLVDSEAVAHGGVVISFQGDGAMILFGLPHPRADDAAKAAQCCIGLCSRTERWLQSLSPSAAPIGFKIGAHCGEIVASRLGGNSYQHITAIGDTVNVASRLMEVAASHRVTLALSDELLRAAGADRAWLTAGALTGPVQAEIRGRAHPVAVWLWRSA